MSSGIERKSRSAGAGDLDVRNVRFDDGDRLLLPLEVLADADHEDHSRIKEWFDTYDPNVVDE